MDDNLRARIADLLAAEMESGELEWYWLAFVNGPEFLGAFLVEAKGTLDATRVAHRLKQTGGTVVARSVGALPPEKYRYRLLSKKDIEDMEQEMPARS